MVAIEEEKANEPDEAEKRRREEEAEKNLKELEKARKTIKEYEKDIAAHTSVGEARLKRQVEQLNHDLDDADRAQDEMLRRVEWLERDLIGCIKLVDLMHDYDATGLEDMRKLYAEMEGQPCTWTEGEVAKRMQRYDKGWNEKKKRTGEAIKALFDNAVRLEKEKGKERFERSAAFMWGMNSGTTRKERALMEAMHELDNNKSASTGESANPKYEMLYHRLLDSEAGIGLLPSTEGPLPPKTVTSSKTWKRQVYDHNMRTARADAIEETHMRLPRRNPRPVREEWD
jgi:hypothetical protein